MKFGATGTSHIAYLPLSKSTTIPDRTYLVEVLWCNESRWVELVGASCAAKGFALNVAEEQVNFVEIWFVW